ncbi:UDP-N-acetyl-alpha-D-muramoyl-L-alanyl-L-glutamate epimerase-like [Tubulanus polymorphus]|uniref:UDP-N-acetyl-alpha-D-muramoyl-L-alanyl-L- glutamate epimerase-like n=1 Tax=Tubulanus polymorphus TaxID=672921 RepID=UPI003DA3CDFA
MAVVLLKCYNRAKHQISMVYGVGDLQFTTSLWYHDVNFYELEDTYGKEYMDRVYFHIAAFEMSKLQSLKPKLIDLGCYEHYHTVAFEKMWLKHFMGAYSQWLYENDLPDYKGPTFLNKPSGCSPVPVEMSPPDGPEMLSLNGGGKDSLMCTTILEKVGVEYGTLGYSGTIYGTSPLQLRLIRDQVNNCTKSRKHHQISMYDDFLDCPIVHMNDVGIKTLQEDETLRAVFGSLPVILQYRYRYMNLGHEKSAEHPNLIWEKNGLPINHQYCKSQEEEMMFDSYIRDNLISNFKYFSILKPINDVLIFTMLNSFGAVHLPYTHSCNVVKPWCKRCAKCAYVWLEYMAYLPTNLVDSIFKENLLDLPENQVYYRQMLGLGKHNAFECVGQIDESRLAFELCKRKGLKGKAMDVYNNEVCQKFDKEAAVERLTEVDTEYDQMPSKFAEDVMNLFHKQRLVARQYLKDMLK